MCLTVNISNCVQMANFVFVTDTYYKYDSEYTISEYFLMYYVKDWSFLFFFSKISMSPLIYTMTKTKIVCEYKENSIPFKNL